MGKLITTVETRDSEGHLVSILEPTRFIQIIEKYFGRRNLFLADAIKVYNEKNENGHKAEMLMQVKENLYNRKVKSDADYDGSSVQKSS